MQPPKQNNTAEQPSTLRLRRKPLGSAVLPRPNQLDQLSKLAYRTFTVTVFVACPKWFVANSV